MKERTIFLLSSIQKKYNLKHFIRPHKSNGEKEREKNRHLRK